MKINTNVSALNKQNNLVINRNNPDEQRLRSGTGEVLLPGDSFNNNNPTIDIVKLNTDLHINLLYDCVGLNNFDGVRLALGEYVDLNGHILTINNLQIKPINALNPLLWTYDIYSYCGNIVCDENIELCNKCEECSCIFIGVAGENIDITNAVVVGEDGLIYNMDVSNQNHMLRYKGLSINIANNGDNVYIFNKGNLNISSLPVLKGKIYFVNVNSKLTSIPPSKYIVQPVGVSISDNVLFVEKETPIWKDGVVCDEVEDSVYTYMSLNLYQINKFKAYLETSKECTIEWNLNGSIFNTSGTEHTVNNLFDDGLYTNRLITLKILNGSILDIIHIDFSSNNIYNYENLEYCLNTTILDLSHNRLEEFNVDFLTKLKILNLNNNLISSIDVIDNILFKVYTNAVDNLSNCGMLNLKDGINATPSTNGLINKVNLESINWVVFIN